MNMQGLLKQAQKMQKDLAKLEKELKEVNYDATAGGGVVKAVVKGDMTLSCIEIDDTLMNKENKEDVQTMVMAAVNEAMKKAVADKEKKTNSVTGGVIMPGGF